MDVVEGLGRGSIGPGLAESLTRPGANRLRTFAAIRSWVIATLGATFILTWPAHAGSGADPLAEEYVVVLHGLARSDRSMQPLAERIAAAGYRVFNVGYPSRDLGPGALVDVLGEALRQCCADAGRIDFVTHSLGGILVRAYAARSGDRRIGRVVMLSPPNRGSELVDRLGDTWLFEILMGPTAVQMGTGPDSLPNRLPPPTFELGVIAATGTINPAGSMVIPGEDDGIVSLCSMWIDGARDIVAVPDSHAFVMRSPEVARQTLRFLTDGRFDHAGGEDVRALVEACAAPAGAR